MTLNEYLEWKQLTDEDFALLIGVRRPTVTRYRNGQRRPDWEVVMPRIVKATGGMVTADSFLGRSQRARRVA